MDPTSHPGDADSFGRAPSSRQSEVPRSATIAELGARGFSHHRLYRGRLIIPTRGVRISPDADPSSLAFLPAFCALYRDAVLSHATAARLHALPIPRHLDRPLPVHLTVPRGRTSARRREVLLHRRDLDPADFVRLHGLLCTTPARTWADLAPELAVEDLVILADHLLRHPRRGLEGRSAPYATVPELMALVDRLAGRRGITRAREALARARIGADSLQETRLRLALVDAGLPEPEVNRPIELDHGRLLHTPDLQYKDYRITIEYEGAHHRTAAQLERDIDRGEQCRREDWIELRIGSRDAAWSWRRAVARVRDALESRGWTGA